MSKQDYLEVLKKFKEQNCEEELSIDIMESIENINPGLSEGSKSYREGNKYLFKQPISYENAEEIMNTLSKAKDYNEDTINIFKDEIRKKCSLITILGESPTEMLIYGTKILGDEAIYINCILDELKNLKDSDQYFLEAYKNILNNWNFNKQLTICIKSIATMYLRDFSKEVYYIFETNSALRKDAAIALIDLECRECYKGMINLLTVMLKDTENREIKDMVRTIFYNLGTKDTEGSTYIYAHYLKSDYLTNEERNIITVGIKPRLTPGILNDMEKRLRDKDFVGYNQTKIIRLLGRLKDKNESCRNLLINIKDLQHINKTEVINAIGEKGEELEALIKDEHAPVRQRTDAIINLGKSSSEGAEMILRNIKTDNKIIKIAAHSALFEKGHEKEIIPIFQYLIDSKSSEEEQKEAKNQIKRLRGLRNEKLVTTLLTVVKKLLEDDKNKTRVLIILDIYSSGIGDEEVGVVFLAKLKSTEISEAKVMILEFFNRNIYRFNKVLQNEIRNEFVRCSMDDIISVKQKALQCLKEINRNSDFIPD